LGFLIAKEELQKIRNTKKKKNLIFILFTMFSTLLIVNIQLFVSLQTSEKYDTNHKKNSNG
jgi:hypothetical protein